MKFREYQILLIDDDEDDYVHIRDLLSDVHSSSYKVTWESSYSSGLKALKERTFDACLLDYRLGEKTGLDLLSEIKNNAFSCPVILLTGSGDFELDVKAMQFGAADYLVKDQLNCTLLERSIRYSIKRSLDLIEIQNGKAQILQQDRLASLGLLASSLAHEIGTPLGIIRSRAELAEKKAAENENLKKDMTVIVSQIDRITKLVNSLLHLAREQKSDFIAAVNMDGVLQDVLNLLEHEFGRKSISLNKKIHSNLQVKAEAGPLGQVLLNILINAMHAIEEARQSGSIKNHEVTLSVAEMNDQIEIVISDTGTGISEENQRHLFRPFFTTKDVGQGTGLGLATSYRIVSSWGGSISVQSRLGDGATFRVLLPKFS